MDVQRIKDIEQLRTLSICHYVVAAISALGSLMFLIHVGIGLGMIFNPAFFASKGESVPPVFIGYAFAGFGSLALILGLGYSAFTAYAGKCLTRQTNRKLIMISSCLNCLSVPIGTALGVFTILAIQKPSISAMFDENQNADQHLATAGLGAAQDPSTRQCDALPGNEQQQVDHTISVPEHARESNDLS